MAETRHTWQLTAEELSEALSRSEQARTSDMELSESLGAAWLAEFRGVGSGVSRTGGSMGSKKSGGRRESGLKRMCSTIEVMSAFGREVDFSEPHTAVAILACDAALAALSRAGSPWAVVDALQQHLAARSKNPAHCVAEVITFMRAQRAKMPGLVQQGIANEVSGFHDHADVWVRCLALVATLACFSLPQFADEDEYPIAVADCVSDMSRCLATEHGEDAVHDIIDRLNQVALTCKKAG